MITKATVKYIQSLQHKKFRDEYMHFIAEGPKVVYELLTQNFFNCIAIYVSKQAYDLLMKSKVIFDHKKLTLIEDFELQKITAMTVPNGILAIFEIKQHFNKVDATQNVILMLDDIQDPGNLGTIIRTADWFGVKDIICSAATADCYNPKVVQSTMASLGRVVLLYTDLAKFLEKNVSAHKYAAVLNGKDMATLKKITSGIIIIGNESKGVSPNILLQATHGITIPKKGTADSLNAAVAAGIIMHSLL